MKAIIVITSILFVMLSMVGFSQTATIDGSACPTAISCPKNVCALSTIDLHAGLTSGSIDSVLWRERIFNGSTWEATYTSVGTGMVQTVPVREPATMSHVYRYQLIVYSGGTSYFALCDVSVYPGPTATLLSNYTTICAGTEVTFTASDGGVGATYNFKINGASAQNSDSSSFATSTLANGDIVTVTITNSGGCSATSAGITMTVWPTPQATTVTGNPIGCVGSNGTVTITGLTGTGPWNLEVWNTSGGVPSSLYYSAGSVGTTNTTINVPIPAVGLTNMYLRVTDSHGCSNQ